MLPDVPANPFHGWKQRDEAHKTWVNIHPSTVSILTKLFWNGRRHKCYRRVQKLKANGTLNCVGTVHLGDHRPSDVFYGGNLKQDMFYHEVKLSEVCACYYGAHFTRGYDVDASLRPDAEMRIGASVYHLELHTGSMRGEKARSRLDIYRDSGATVLWVALDQTNVDYLLGLDLPKDHWVSRLDIIQQEPYGWVWVNTRGQELCIERE